MKLQEKENILDRRSPSLEPELFLCWEEWNWASCPASPQCLTCCSSAHRPSMDLLALTCHTHSWGCLGWQLSFMPLRRLEQHSPRRAPACSTQTCLIAYITIEQSKLSVHSEYSTWQHPYKTPYRATGRGKKRIWDFLSICPKQSSSKSVLSQSSQVCMGLQGKTSDGCSHPSQRWSTNTQCRRSLRQNAGGLGRTQPCSAHRAKHSTASLHTLRRRKEATQHSCPCSLCQPTLWDWCAGATGVPTRKQEEECFYIPYRLQRINCNLFLLAGNMVLQELTNIIYHVPYLHKIISISFQRPWYKIYPEEKKKTKHKLSS